MAKRLVAVLKEMEKPRVQGWFGHGARTRACWPMLPWRPSPLSGSVPSLIVQGVLGGVFEAVMSRNARPVPDHCSICCRPCPCPDVVVYSCLGDHDEEDNAEMPAGCFMHGMIIHKLFAEREFLNVRGFTCERPI